MAVRKFRFYKNNHKWYIDLPEYLEAGGDINDLEMIFGADQFIESFLDHGNEVELWISDNYLAKGQKLYKSLNKPKEGGCFYIHDPYDYNPINPDTHHVLWLCDVTKFVFGDFPKVIYFKKDE